MRPLPGGRARVQIALGIKGENYEGPIVPIIRSVRLKGGIEFARL